MMHSGIHSDRLHLRRIAVTSSVHALHRLERGLMRYQKTVATFNGIALI
jgi:hypothetical protein